VERFGHDVLDLENGTAALAEACGCEAEYPVDEPPRVTKPAIAGLDEVNGCAGRPGARRHAAGAAGRHTGG